MDWMELLRVTLPGTYSMVLSRRAAAQRRRLSELGEIQQAPPGRRPEPPLGNPPK